MKGLVVDVQKDRCIVLKADGTFCEMRRKHAAIGQEIIFPKALPYRMLCAAASLVLACITALGGHYISHASFSYIYLDINPSVRLDLNYFEEVLSVVPLNADAESLLQSNHVVSGEVEACIQNIVRLCVSESYIHEENSDIEISMMTHSLKLENRIQETCAQLEEQQLMVSVFTLDQEENQLALRQRRSAKYLRAIKEYTHFFGGTLEENMQLLQERTADEILEQIRLHRRTTPGKDARAGETLLLTGKQKAAQNTKIKPEERTHAQEERRNTALQRYTDVFGGTPEENAAVLRDASISEIYTIIREYRQNRHSDGS